MVQCAVRGCRSRTDTIGVSSRMVNAVHFHRVPQDPGIRKKWCQAIKRTVIKDSTRVCSVHFRKDNYYSTKLGLQKLAIGSVPELRLPKEEKKKDEESISSEDEKMSEDSVSDSSIIKPGVQKYKVRTPLEKRLLKEVLRLKEQGKQKMEAIHCLLEQNKRLLKRNSFLEKALQNSKKVTESANRVAQQETNFFKSASVNPNVSITIND